MRILLIGDTSGNLDEGMKKVSYRLSEYLNKVEDCYISFVSMAEVLKGRNLFNDVDIIHFMGGPSWRTFVYGCLLKLVLKSRIIISFIHPKWSVLADVFFRFCRPDAVIVQTEKWRNKAQKVVGNISSIPLGGINRKKFYSISLVEKQSLKKELGLPLNKIILLHVGHLNYGRNLTVLNQFKDSNEVLPVVIGSSTVTPNVELVTSLEKNGVKIISGYIPEIEKYYKAADCYIFPTSDANFAIQIPLSVLEALASNIPVISTKYEALPFYLEENQPFLTYIDAFENLEDIVKGVVSNYKYNLQNDRVKLEKFEWVNISKELHDFYRKLIVHK